MQIACKRYSCQKAVEVCYWSCKFRRNCKDWQNALAGEPGVVAIQSRLEAAAAKSGRAFDAQTLVVPARQAKQPPLVSPATVEAVAAKVSVVSRPALTVQSNSGTRSDVAMLSRAQLAASSTTESNPKARKTEGKKKMARAITEPSNGASDGVAVESSSEKPVAAKTKKAQPKAPRAKQPSNGKVYLLLSKNGKYKELRESDLLNQAATLLKDPSLRLVKGQLLVPTISFQATEE